MTSLSMGFPEFRSLVGPVLPWVARSAADHEGLHLVRIFTNGGHVYAAASDGVAAAVARVQLTPTDVVSGPVDFMAPATALTGLVERRDVNTVELEDHGDRIGVTLLMGDYTLALGEIRTYQHDPFWHAGPIADAVLAAVVRGVPGLTADTLDRISKSLAYYGRPGQVAAEMFTGTDELKGMVVVAHTDRFLLVTKGGAAGLTGDSTQARHVGVTLGRGSRFVWPADAWPTILQEVSL